MTAACHYINTAMKDMKRIFAFLFFVFFGTVGPGHSIPGCDLGGGGGAGVEMALFCFNK